MTNVAAMLISLYGKIKALQALHCALHCTHVQQMQLLCQSNQKKGFYQHVLILMKIMIKVPSIKQNND